MDDVGAHRDGAVDRDPGAVDVDVNRAGADREARGDTGERDPGGRQRPSGSTRGQQQHTGEARDDAVAPPAARSIEPVTPSVTAAAPARPSTRSNARPHR